MTSLSNNSLLQNIREYLATGNIQEALTQLRYYLADSSPDISNETLIHQHRYIRLNEERRKDIITRDTYEVGVNRLVRDILDFMSFIEKSQNIRITEEQPSFLDQYSSRALRVFLCHSSKDKLTVRKIYHQLCCKNIDPWLDEEKILPGQDWKLEIKKAVRNSDVVIVCLSNKSISKTGFIHKEIKMALEIAEEQPEGAIFIIPLKLDECEVPERLQRWQWVSYFEENGYNRLMTALQFRSAELGLKY